VIVQWVPEDIQAQYGRRIRYAAMDMNIPSGEALELDESKLDEIILALEAYGFEPRRDDALVLAALGMDINPNEGDEV